MQQLVYYIKQALQPLYPPEEVRAMTALLLEKRFGIRMLDVYMGKDRQLSPDEAKDLEDILARLRRNEPLQYVLGEAEFDGLTFGVDRRVLIPRPETAELVGWMAAEVPSPSFRLLDIGTGSGCIPIALARRFPEAECYGWDCSAEALDVAAANNRRNGTSVTFERRDIFADDCRTGCRFEVVVSNPPYIMERERSDMSANVLDWEPETALFVPDDDPLRFYRRIGELAAGLLVPGGRLFFEINRACGAETVKLLAHLGYRDVELRKDLSGNDRMIKARL